MRRDNIRRMAIGLSAIVLVALSSGHGSSQEAPMRPLSEDLERIRSSDDWLLLATRRCSALFTVAAEWRRGLQDPGTAEMYTGWSIGFDVRALDLAETIGREWDLRDVREVNERAIGQLAERLRDRMRRAGNFANDPLLASDLRTCRDLVDELRL